MPELCAKHNVALDPEGQCVICRRPEVTVDLRPAAEPDFASRAVTAFLGLCLLLALGALAYITTLPAPYRGPRYRPDRRHASAVDAPVLSEGELAALAFVDDAGLTDEVAESVTLGEVPAADAAVEMQTAPVVLPPVPPSPPLAAPVPDPALLAARAKVQVTMYAAPWCYICDRARRFLREAGVILVEHNVDGDAEALKRLAKLAPGGALPTFELGGEVVIGYNPASLGQRIDALAGLQLAARSE